MTQPVGTGTVSVYADTNGSAGLTNTADAAAGACADGLALSTPAGTLDGGTAEVGAAVDDPTVAGEDDDPQTQAQGDGATPDAYTVVDGDNDNQDPQGQSDGYIGVSNYETGTARGDQASCASGPDGGQGTTTDGTSNSGGCVGTDLGGWQYIPGDVPTLVCGNSSGNSWTGDGNSDPNAPNRRDGCSIP